MISWSYGRRSSQTVVSGLIIHIVPLIPGLNTILKDGINVLDIGCGSGNALNALATYYSKSAFVGCGLLEAAILSANSEAVKLENLT